MRSTRQYLGYNKFYIKYLSLYGCLRRFRSRLLCSRPGPNAIRLFMSDLWLYLHAHPAAGSGGGEKPDHLL